MKKQPDTTNTPATIEFRQISGLVPYARNARTHSDEQVSQLMASIAEWWFTNPVLADAAGIVAGHGRMLAATRIYSSGKSISLPNGSPIPDGTVPVIDVTGWSEAKRRAYKVAILESTGQPFPDEPESQAANG